jgi:hypothetical protein
MYVFKIHMNKGVLHIYFFNDNYLIIFRSYVIIYKHNQKPTS